MFKKLLKSSILFGFMGVCTFSYSQVAKQRQSINTGVQLLSSSPEKQMASKKEVISEKVVCGWDIIDYTFAKNLNPDGLLDLWGTRNASGYVTAISQYFENPGEIALSGVFIACRGAVPGLTFNVEISDAATGTVLGTTTATAPTTFGWVQATLSSPILVDGPYYIDLYNTSTTQNIAFGANTSDDDSGRDEDFAWAQFEGDWYPSSFLYDELADIHFNADYLVAPVVGYEFSSDFTINTTPSCVGNDIELTNISTPFVENRFFNPQAFDNYFFGTPDNTYTWTLADGSTVNTKDATTTHTTAGTYTVTLDISFETWIEDVCEDTKSETIEFQGDDATFNYGVSTVCVGSSDITPSSVATAGGTFSATGGLIIDAATGEIDMTNSPVGSYVITYSFSGACPSSFTQNIEITNSPDASFSYSVGEFCSNGTNPSPIAATAGTFSSTAGLSINPSTGEINLAASTPDTYTITNEVSIAGCPVVSETFDVTINAAPSVTANADNTEICLGEEITLTGSGADTYDWDNGVTDGVAFDPAAGTVTYTVTGTDANGCTNTATVDVTVNALPTVSGGADLSVCDGDQITLSGSGANTYDWDNGVTNGVAFTQTAGTTETYTVTGTDANGCENTATVDVTVNALPTVDAGADQTVCEGTQVTLSGSGADSYDWDNGVTDGVAFTATTTETYTVTGTDVNGCENTATVDVTVNVAPSVSLDALGTVCDNVGNITLSGGAPAGGTYSGPGVSGGIFDPVAAGEGTHTITYTYEDGNGCEGSATASIEVDACVGIEAGNVETLSVFPNPASSVLNVVFENVSGTDATVVLTTTDGKVVYQASAKAMSLFNEKINVTDFANGVYFINIKSETTSLVQRVVLN